MLYFIFLIFLVYWVEHPKPFFFNSLNLQKDPGEKLEGWLRNFHWGSRLELKEKWDLPVYKFYSGVIETLLLLGRQMGGNYQDAFLFLRDGLQIDRQFEKKLKELILGCWLQIGMIMLLTWGFIVGAIYLVKEVNLAWEKLFLILLWQSVGMILLPVVLKKLRTRYFGEIGKMWRMLYVLQSLARVPLSRPEIFERAGIKDLNQIKQASLLPLVERFKDCCQKALKLGGSYEEEVKHLMSELRFLEKWHFELFEKRLVVLKLFLLSVFFLPSYMAFIFVLLGDLFTLM